MLASSYKLKQRSKKRAVLFEEQSRAPQWTQYPSIGEYTISFLSEPGPQALCEGGYRGGRVVRWEASMLLEYQKVGDMPRSVTSRDSNIKNIIDY